MFGYICSMLRRYQHQELAPRLSGKAVWCRFSLARDLLGLTVHDHFGPKHNHILLCWEPGSDMSQHQANSRSSLWRSKLHVGCEKIRTRQDRGRADRTGCFPKHKPDYLQQVPMYVFHHKRRSSPDGSLGQADQMVVQEYLWCRSNHLSFG